MKKSVFVAVWVCLSAVAVAENDQVLIQSGAFKNQVLADRQAAKVSLLGVPSKVVELRDAEGNIVRVVRSNHSMSQKDAEAVVDRLEKNNVHAMLLSD